MTSERPSAPFAGLTSADTLAQHLSAIVEHSHDAILSKNLHGTITSWNAGAERLFGYTAEEAIGQPVTLLIPPDRLDEEPALLEKLKAGERTDHYETVRRRKDGSLVSVSLTLSPIRNAAGEIVGASKILRDISERQQALERQNLLLEEIRHRMKNFSAVVEALAWQSRPPGEPAVEAFLTVFLGRLRTLLSTGDLVMASSSRQADLRDVFAGVLAPFSDAERPSRITLDGPSLVAPERTVGALALAMHELATNALKYGALKIPEGRVSLRWRAEPEGDHRQVVIEWKETGGPPLAGPPERLGFGSRLIRSMAAQEKEGVADIAFEPDGLRCAIRFRLESSHTTTDGLGQGPTLRGKAEP